MNSGIDALRRKRGEERVTFADIADHLDDYASLHPDLAPAMDAFATFVATIEDREHGHDALERGSDAV